MASNYCGKSCDECTYKEQLNCPGCEHGPGNPWTGTCKIARCCDDKGHKNCSTCGYMENCGPLGRKHMIPKERLEEVSRESGKQERIAKMAPKLSKWLPILFWTSIAATIAGFFANDNLDSLIPMLYYIGVAAEMVCTLIYGAILLIISTESGWYRTAGIFGIVSPIASVIVASLAVLSESPIFLLLTVVVLVISLYGQYAEFKGHAEVLTEVDPELSEKWDKLWKWNLILYAALIGSILLLLLAPFLGAISSLATLVGALVIEILKPLYLYRTAETFKYIK